MFVIELAGVSIGIRNRYPFIERQCRAFLSSETDVAFVVEVTPEEIALESNHGEYSDGYSESICVYRHICEEIAAYNVFLIHGSVIEHEGAAYAFLARSGVGKSTHTRLWLKNIPASRVLNGDKPLLRVEEDGSVTACGTPWNGKENWGENISAPLRAICFLERGEKNEIRAAEEEEILPRLMHQVYLRGERESVERRLVMMDALMRAVPYYVLRCTISDEAALVAYRAMSKIKERGKSDADQ
ncbi:MAG: hypothetical protein E7643_05610 [Ruminococcaceae bacterium]|nr:hypothetical protein [Oscillospiraceae bacterium]